MGSFFSLVGALGVAALIISLSFLAFLAVAVVFGSMFLSMRIRDAIAG
ncbi:hypothetical protein [Natronoglycomyces albus]|uniref:Uncharacterized protein n=1 Tax=Natronoglycomyces albus TaxID=2811108 RepID=A0A895XTS9_9ACTN|nr:hypothetical protein [Natronoglycomyces albus]QSB06725.1 hypothetical protein JQS30_07495 [Natronoglycomyces albus]